MSEPAAAAREVVGRYFTSINGDRFDELRTIFDQEISLEMAGAAPRRGVDDAVAYYPLALAALPEHVDDPVAVFVSADARQVAVEIDFRGAMADGRRVHFSAVDLFDLTTTGKIVRLRSFYDTARVARLLAGSDHG